MKNYLKFDKTIEYSTTEQREIQGILYIQLCKEIVDMTIYHALAYLKVPAKLDGDF